MKRVVIRIASIFLFVHSQSALAQCGTNTNSGTQCSPRSGFYDNQYNADLGCGSYREITNYSPGEYFRMPVLLGGCYTIQTCGSPIDTQISVYQGTNTTTPYSRNDDNGPVCTGSAASVIITPNFTDYTRVDVRQYNCQPGGTSSITVRIRQNNNLNITSSSADMCQGQTRSLTATPARATGGQAGSGNDGTFTGTGVSGTTFTAPTPVSASQDYIVTYTFGYCTTTQSITVYRNPTTAAAGNDQNICVTVATLNANAPAVGTGSWSVVSGTVSGLATSNPSSTVTLVSATATLRWTVSNGACTSSTDDVVLTRDNVNPVISCPSNITETATSNQCNRTVAYSVTASDACGATTSLTSGLGSNGSFPVGTTTESWTATDAAGNIASCSFTVTITDNQNPSIICPANISVNNTVGVCGAAVSYAAVTSSDNCPGQTVSTFSGGASGSVFPIGTGTVVLRATDASSNTAQCSFTVTVTDNENPILSCPSNINVSNDAGDCFAAVTWIPATATDNCTAGTPSQSSGLNSGADFPVGTSTVVYTASDNNSNTGTCQFTVTVTDSEDPEIACPADISLQAASGSCSENVSYSTPTATDNCSVSSVSLTSSSASGSSFNVGASTVTWTATDAAGRTDVCSFTVTVLDSQNPSISCPSDISVAAPSGACAASVTYSNPVALDNCPGVTSAITTGQISGSSFGVGINPVTYTATDASSNTATCSFTVTVLDNENPVIAGCPSNISEPNDAGLCSGVVNWTEPTVTDNCTGATISITGGQASNTSFPAETTVTVTYLATDASGNTATCSFDVRVEDEEDPSVTCPANITVPNSSGLCGAASGVVTFSNASFSDNCAGVTLVQTAGATSGSSFSVGTETITFVATDAASNINTCSFTVTVNDNEAPNYLVCPTDFDINTDNGVCTSVVTYPTLLADDNCAGSVTPVMTTTGTGSGSVFLLGPTTVTYTATDGSSNVSTCSFVVTVNDEEGPQLNCPSNQTVTFDGSCQYELLNYNSQVGFLLDNCDTPTLVQSPAAATTITGSTEITITATDLSGNASTCSFFVNPNDIVDPAITCPSDQQVAVNSICQFTLPNYVNAVVSDDCDPNPGVVQSPIAGAILTSSTPITLTVTDASGNSSSCTFNAEPFDATNPTISCPSNQLEVFNASCEFDVINYTGLASTADNCAAPVTVTQSPILGTTITGNTSVTLTATDGNNNTSVCTFTVIPQDNVNPTIACPADLNVSYNLNCLFTLGNYISGATPLDNCDSNPSVAQSPVAGTSIASTTNIVLTVTDASGNTATCNFDVIPSDGTAPNVTCPSNQLVNLNASCESSLLSYTSSATVSDNCDGAPSVTQSPASGTTITANTTVTISVEDAENNTNSCDFAVIVQDIIAPTITCAADINVNFNSSCEFVVGNYLATPVSLGDNCAGTPTVTQSPATGATISGQSAITLTATDASGNTSACSFNIIPVDGQNPSVTCPNDINVDFDASCAYALADYTGQASATDNCDQSVTVTQSPGFGTVISGSTTVTITGTDDAGNTGNCSFAVIPSDNTVPIITCPSNQSEVFSASCDFVLPDYTSLATAADNCDNSVLVTQSPGATTTIIGSQVITLTAVDNDNNSTSCVFSVLPVDNTAPVITCPADENVSFNSQCQFVIVNYTGLASAVDNCGGVAVITQSPASGSSIGTTSAVTLTATDADGNASSCSFDVIPSDNTIPTVSCPGNQTVNFNAGCSYTLLSYVGQVNTDDNCDASPTLSQSPASGTSISATTVITITSTDLALNANTCTFSVIPVDNTNPTIVCPVDLNVSFDAGCQFTLTDYASGATAADNCDASPSVAQSPNTGSVITGLTEITLTVTDASGNLATCTFDVIPDDDVDPTITCPGPQTVSSNASCQFVVLDYTGNGNTDDNCDASVSVTQSPAFGTIISIPTTVTLTAEDDNVNTATCTFLVTPADNDNPNITCPGDQTVAVDAACGFDVIDYTGLATATDNCSGTPTVTQDVLVGTTITGTTTITLTATDDDTNTAACTFDVIPEDSTEPVVTCPGAQTPTLGAQCQLVIPDYTGLGSVADNCDSGLSISQSPVTGSTIGGATTVTLASIDGAGNIGTCVFLVTPSDNTAPFISCPADIVESFDAGCEFDLLSYVSLATVSDNCTPPPYTVTQSPIAGTTVSGNTTIVLSVMDGSSNVNTCSFDILPNDDVDPTIVCPADQTVSFDASCQYSLQDYTSSATVDDNCDSNPTVTQTAAAGTTLSGNAVVTIEVEDAAGNTASCSFNVVAEDDTNPSVVCPGNQTVNATADCGFTVADATGLATISDNCDNTLFITQSPSVGSIVSGTTTITVTAVDDAGNTASCNFDIAPVDITVPTITCPNDLLVDLSATCDFTLTDYTSLAVATDNCDNSLTLVQSPNSGVNIGSSTSTVTITAIDDAGNSSVCTFDVIPEDNTAPSITCPQDAVVQANPNCQYVLPDYTGSIAPIDNCDQSAVVTQSPISGTSIGSATTVTLSATDASGNVGTCSVLITPEDNQVPVFANCPADIQVDNDVDACEAVVSYATLSVSDNCDGVLIPQLTAGGASGTPFIVGTTLVTYTATDADNNVATCSFNVTVVDVEDPVILCPTNITTTVTPLTCGADVTYNLPTATDNCSTGIVPSLEAGFASGATFPLGATVVTYEAEDAAGNTESCSFTITVTDNEEPVITCPADVVSNVGINSCQAFVNYSSPTVTDNCATGLTPVLTSGISSGSAFPLGVTTVVYQANDGNGNVSTCSFTVTVNDNILPIMFGCPIDITVNVEPGTCGQEVNYANPVATDNCIGAITPTLENGLASGSTFPLGATTILYEAEDAATNVATCSFVVTVIDNEDPVITCPADISVFAILGTCEANVTYALPTVTDNCITFTGPTLTGGLASGASFPEGPTTVSYSVVDGSGNMDDCSFVVTVEDNERPTLTCPADFVVSNDLGTCDAVVTYNLPTVDDNCSTGLVPYIIIGQVSGSTFGFGDNTISYEAVDGSGNTNTCTFTLTVEDNELPVLTCPNDTIISCDAVVAYDNPIASDNCNPSPVPIQVAPASGFTFPLGPTTVTFDAEDGNGNTGTCSFTVTVSDTTAPVIACPINQFESFDAACQLVLPDYTILGTDSDNCDASPVVSQTPAASVTVTGTTTVTLVSTDVSGNQGTCTFSVIDNTPPVVSCPSNQVVGADINCQFTLLDYTTLVTTTDNCGTSGLAQSPSAGTLVSSNTTVEITATDDFGNTSTCQFDVELIDNIQPSITCIGNQVGLFDANCEYQLPDYTGQAFADDNCDAVPVITQFPAAGQLVQGDTIITLTATDADGNSISCSFSLSPSDNISPVITCPGSQQALFDATCSFLMDDYTGSGSVSDNCSSVSAVTQSPVVGSTHAANTIVTLTAMDEAGNSSSCVFVVVPADEIAPTVTCPVNQDVAVNANCEFILSDYTTSATTADNCSNSIVVTQSPSVGSSLSSSVLVTLTANDGNGNSSTCDFTLTPDDQTPPVVVCNADIVVDFDANCGFEISDYIGFITATDNCAGAITYAQSPVAGTVTIGPSSVELTATDANGNSASCSFGILPVDMTAPIVSCPADQNVNLDATCGFELPDYVALATITDNCQLNSVTQSLTVGAVITSQTAIVLIATDNAGNSESCTFDVIPSDVTNPIISCPQDIEVSVTNTCEVFIDDYRGLVQIFDNCSNTVIDQSPDEGTAVTQETEIIFTVTDGGGNAVNCSFMVTPVDNTIPTIACPQNTAVYLDNNCQFEIPDYRTEVIAEDNCLSTGLALGQFPPLGTVIVANTVVTITAEDANGNQADCSFAIEVQDTVAPVITVCPPDATIPISNDCEIVLADFSSQVTAIDNCDGIIVISQIPAAGSSFVGAASGPITMIATDADGNTAQCQFIATAIDVIDPTVTCPADQTVELNATCEFVLPDYTLVASSSDACGLVTLTQSPLPGAAITTQLNATIIAEDESGNTTTCTFFVTPQPIEVSVQGTDATCNAGDNGSAIATATGGTPPYTEDWGGFDPTALGAGSYSVILTDANGCSAIGNVTIEDGSLFELEITPNGTVYICEGESVQLSADPGYAIYNWSTGASVASISVSNEASYWLQVTDANGCVSDVDTATVVFYDAVAPEITVSPEGLLVSSNDTAQSYQWYLNGAPIPDATTSSICPAVSGNYVLAITDDNGCEVESFTNEITFNEDAPCLVGIEEYGLSLDVYPNPSTGVFTVNYALEQQTDIQLAVFDLLGSRVGNDILISSQSGTKVIDLSQEANGVYLLRITLGNDKVLQQRLILVK